MRLQPTLYICFLLLGLTSCQPGFSDLSNQQKVMPVELDNIEDYYWDVAWISKDTIIFNYTSDPSWVSKPATPDLHSYNPETRKWKKITLLPNQGCWQLTFTYLQRLPNQQLGFVRVCNNHGEEARLIEELNLKNGEIKVIAGSDILHSAGQFSFSPDMSEFVQENMIGIGLSNQLFYRKGKDSTRIVPDFVRAMYPVWSPHEKMIAFLGTENYQGGNPTEFKTLSEILGLNSSPWDLYVSSPDGSNLRKIVSSIKNLKAMEWSPKEKRLAFAGEFNGIPGIWLVDPATSVISKIWSKSSIFAWSPDGSKFVVLDKETDQDNKVISEEISILDLILK